MLPLHLTAPLLPRPASLPKAGFAMLQGQTTQQLAPLPPQSDSRQPRPTSRPGSPEHEQRQRPRGCTAPPNRSPARSPREREQFAQPRDASGRQWQSRRRLQYCGSCGVEFYNPRRRHSSIKDTSHRSTLRAAASCSSESPPMLASLPYVRHDASRTKPFGQLTIAYRAGHGKMKLLRGRDQRMSPSKED